MRDVEKMLTEVREAIIAIRNLALERSDDPGFDQRFASIHAKGSQALTAFTAEMPGAIGVCVAFSKINRHMTDELDAALAKLEVK